MEIGNLLKRSEDAFKNRDWKELKAVSEMISSQPVEDNIRDLARGFYHYASSRLQDDPEKSVAELENAIENFQGNDEVLTSMTRTERLILLSGIDEENRPKHLKALGEHTMKDFSRSADPNQLLIAIRAFEDAKSLCEGPDEEEISKNLTFCLANYAPHSDDPGILYERILKISRKLASASEKKGNRPDLARARMNEAIADQKLAFIKDNALVHKAVDAAAEAVEIFEKEGLDLEMVRAKQSLANIYKDAAHLEPSRKVEFLEAALAKQREAVETFKDNKYTTHQAYAAMEVSATLMELGGLVPEKRDDYLEKAARYIEESKEIFKGEKMGVEFGQAKMALGVIKRNLGQEEEARELLRQAAEVFAKEEMPDLKEKAESLAGQ